MRNKIIYVFLLLILIGITGCKEKEDTPKQVVKEEKIVVEIGTDVKKQDLIKNEKLKVIDDDYVDTASLGEKKIIIEYYEEGKKNKKEVTYQVKDQTPPVVMLNSTYSVKKGYDKSIAESIFCADNYDKKPNCEVEGEYNLNEIGEYDLKYVATDSSNNKTEVPFTLKVIEETKQQSTTTLFEDVYNAHKTDKTEIGIDVSKWQGKINFEKVKEKGASFVMIRLGYQNGYDGALMLDPYFKTNIEGAKKAGLKVGVYFFSYAKTTEDAISQAKYIADNLKNYNLDLPVSLDWENWGSFNKLNMNFIELNNIASVFLKEIENYGYNSMIYSSKNYLDKVWMDKNKKTVWLAHYTSKTTYDKPYIMWQLCSNGKIDGINGYVDINIMYNN